MQSCGCGSTQLFSNSSRNRRPDPSLPEDKCVCVSALVSASHVRLCMCVSSVITPRTTSMRHASAMCV